MGSIEEDHLDLARILSCCPCNSLMDIDTLSSGPNPKGKFYVTSGYLELDRKMHGTKNMSWWKQVWNKFSWLNAIFNLVGGPK